MGPELEVFALRGSLDERLRLDRSSQIHPVSRALKRRRCTIQCIRKLGEHLDVDGTGTEGHCTICLETRAQNALCREEGGRLCCAFNCSLLVEHRHSKSSCATIRTRIAGGSFLSSPT